MFKKMKIQNIKLRPALMLKLSEAKCQSENQYKPFIQADHEYFKLNQ